MALITVMAYWRGTSGDFLFDDFANLTALGRYGGVRDAQTLLYYLTSGIADPTGRPVAMLSFLIDATDWPADPFPFKRTNILLHGLNGMLLYGVLSALGRQRSPDSVHIRTAALLATAMWLFHPLWVSTVLYVVQRHAMLAAFFVLAGIRAWISSREAFNAGRSGRGWMWAILAVPIFGLLAGLSKANGFLLPMLLAVLELSVLRSGLPQLPPQKWATRLFVWLPASLLVGWLCWHAMQIGLDGTHGRPWTLGERLLTQPRVLCAYLWQLLVPGLDATGVFADGLAVSQSWRTPWTTVPALLVVGAIAGAAWSLRRRAPVLAAGLGFFLAGHALESSVVMLELYFEHRNYLPAVLLFWPLAWWLAAPGRLRRWLLIGAIGYTGLMLLATTAQARLWGDPLSLALVWAEQNPHSGRAQTHAFHYELAAGRHASAERRLSTLLDANPQEPQFALSLLNLRCQQQRASSEDIQRAASAITASRGLALDINYQWLSSVLLPDGNSECSDLPAASLMRLLKAATLNAGQPVPNNPEMRAREQLLIGHFALRQKDCSAARQAFERRVEAQPRPEFVQSQTSLLATYCGPGQGLAHLNRYLDASAPVAKASSPMLRLRDHIMQTWWKIHWQELRHILQTEARPSRADTAHTPSFVPDATHTRTTRLEPTN